MTFILERVDPMPLSTEGLFDKGPAEGTSLLALNIEAKYLFLDDEGQVYHQYQLPTDPDVHNCGSYVRKLIMYRDPLLFEYLSREGVSKASFASPRHPILASRSPQLDLVLFEAIRLIRSQNPGRQVSLFDHGCTVSEHYDLLDVMLRAASDSRESAASCVSYVGLDKAALLLTASRLLHADVPSEHFRLMHTEGSAFNFSPGEFDLSLSVGVVNHVFDPLNTLEKLLRCTRYMAAFVLWTTSEPEGFWAMNHNAVRAYFFSMNDLAAVQRRVGTGRFLRVSYTPEVDTSQPKSYIGLGESKLQRLGSHHLVYTSLTGLPFEAQPLG